MTTPEIARDQRLTVIGEYGTWWLVACERCPEGKERAERHLLAGCGDPSPELLQVRLDSLRSYGHQQAAIAASVALVADPRGWLTLAGSYGVGKSTLIWGVLNHLRDAGIVGMYWTAARLLDHIRSGIGLIDGSGKSERDIIGRLITMPALAIDELDKYNPTGYADNQLFTVLNERYRRWEDGVTMLAYNDGGAVHPALMSRIKDGRFAFIEMKGPDLRPAMQRD